MISSKEINTWYNEHEVVIFHWFEKKDQDTQKRAAWWRQHRAAPIFVLEFYEGTYNPWRPLSSWHSINFIRIKRESHWSFISPFESPEYNWNIVVIISTFYQLWRLSCPWPVRSRSRLSYRNICFQVNLRFHWNDSQTFWFWRQLQITGNLCLGSALPRNSESWLLLYLNISTNSTACSFPKLVSCQAEFLYAASQAGLTVCGLVVASRSPVVSLLSAQNIFIVLKSSLSPCPWPGVCPLITCGVSSDKNPVRRQRSVIPSACCFI